MIQYLDCQCGGCKFAMTVGYPLCSVAMFALGLPYLIAIIPIVWCLMLWIYSIFTFEYRTHAQDHEIKE